jgi:O-antigen/teichoic acid export membrane protein
MIESEAIKQEELAGGVASPVQLERAAFDRAMTIASGRGGHGWERNRRLIRSIVAGVLTRPLAIAISFVSVPLFLRYLGAERYGLYEAIVAMSAWLSLSNAGVTYGLINKLTDCNVSGDRQLARRYVSSLFFAYLGVSIVLVVLASLATPLIHWQALFPTSDAEARAEVPWVVWATAVTTFAALIAGLPYAGYAAYQEMDRNNLWDGAAKLATLAGCFAVVRIVPPQWGLLGVAMVMLALPTFVRAINTLLFFTVEKPWLRPSRALFDVKLLRSAFAEGIYIFVLQMGAIVIFQTDKMIISSVLGGEQVAAFAVLGRLFLLAYGAFALLLVPLWPAYGEAGRRGDVRWVRRTLRVSLVLGCGTMLLCGVVMFFFGDAILRLWTRGQPLLVSRHLILAATALFMVRAAVECQSVVLNAAGVLVPQMFLLGANAVLNLAAGIVLARKFGVIGVAWSFPLTALLTSRWGYPWLIRRHLGAGLEKQQSAPASVAASAAAAAKRGGDVNATAPVAEGT